MSGADGLAPGTGRDMWRWRNHPGRTDGIVIKAPTSFVVVIMIGLSFITGLTGGLKIGEVLRLVVKGMADM
jgi:hypothetical protein